MSKKRERQAKQEGDDGPAITPAEAALFQLASDVDDTNKSVKRIKSTDFKSPAGSTGAGDGSSSNNNDDNNNEQNNSTDKDALLATEMGPPVSPLTELANGAHPAAIAPSSALRHCDGFDVVRKGSRGRGRQLMVLPGALGVGGGGGGGGRLGTLKNVTSRCPVLYIDFPEVRVRLWCWVGLQKLLGHGIHGCPEI